MNTEKYSDEYIKMCLEMYPEWFDAYADDNCNSKLPIPYVEKFHLHHTNKTLYQSYSILVFTLIIVVDVPFLKCSKHHCP